MNNKFLPFVKIGGSKVCSPTGMAVEGGAGPRGIIQDMIRYNGNLKPLSKELRNKMTDAERKIWFKINRKQLKGYQFYRQKILGSYIVDFYCPKANIVIEIDGSQHLETIHKVNDEKRDKSFLRLGIKVLRYNDRDALINTEAVLKDIWQNLP